MTPAERAQVQLDLEIERNKRYVAALRAAKTIALTENASNYGRLLDMYTVISEALK